MCQAAQVESVPTEGAPGTTRTCLPRGKATLPSIAAPRAHMTPPAGWRPLTDSTDLRIKQARTPHRRRFHCRSGFCGRVGAFVLGFCPFIGDSLGRAAG